MHDPENTITAPAHRIDALDRQSAEAARRVGERLQGELSSLIRSLPVDRQTIVELSTWLGITQPVCQRLLRAIRHKGDALIAITYFPGVRGVRQVIEAAADRNADGQLVAAASAAIDAYALLIEEHGGSQARLISAINGNGDGDGGATAVDLRVPISAGDTTGDPRQMMFEGARSTTGRSFETHLAAYIYRPDQDPALMHCVTAMGMIGIRRSAGCMAICPMKTYSSGQAAPDDQAALDEDGPIALMPGFCSDPIPRIMTRAVRSGLPVLVDPDRASRDPIDVVICSRCRSTPHPMATETTLEECALVSDGPARHLVMTAFLHRNLAQASIASLGVFAPGNRGPIGLPVAGPDGSNCLNQSVDRWFDRLPERPRLEYLGLGLAHADTHCYDRATELFGTMFREQGWDPDEFVGYRCEIAYPIWGAQYVMTFDFESVDE